MLSKTFNLVLLNLCSANLVGAVLVKSISVVHHGYAVAANVLESEVAFCLLYTVINRITMGVLPWSLVTCCWLSVVPRARTMQVFLQGHPIKEISLSRRKGVALLFWVYEKGSGSRNSLLLHLNVSLYTALFVTVCHLLSLSVTIRHYLPLFVTVCHSL